MLVKTYGSTVFGIDATTITIEVNVANGVNFILVGLPDNAVKESQQRIKAALKNNNLKYPGKEITVNLAPADIRKEGSTFDLPIAIGILAASEQIKANKLSEYLILGELSLDGKLNPMKGVLPIAIQAKKENFKGIILPKENAKEAAIVNELEVYGAENLNEVVNLLNGKNNIQPTKIDLSNEFESKLNELEIDFKDVKGQSNIKRAFEIAAAGGHNVILIGPPGSGKSMLAKRFPTILPPMTIDESLETTKIHSVAGKTGKEIGLITQRPFRKPHHTISDVALVGGGGYPQPGEISLAHNGVLFLDELPEYKRTVLEVMRQPLEDRNVTISRAKFSIDFPAGFMLVAAMNPCPCGYYNHPEKECLCGSGNVQKYLNKISGPLLDRIDLHVEVTPVNYNELTSKEESENSKSIRERVIQARLIQEKRFESNKGIHCNAQMNSKSIQTNCNLEGQSIEILKNAMDKLGLSARAYDRILKVARTIADLDNAQNIESQHISEAIQFRNLDKDGWAG
ncbi:MAG: YifB family Mg chelatase-like AAA ATPase [Crocinitomicaceae bacterium]